MLAKNRGGHYETDKSVIQMMTEKSEEMENRRQKVIKKPTVRLGGEGGRAASHEAQRLPELRIVLLGERHAGKSSAGNTILGREQFDTGRVTEQCVRRQEEVAGRLVTVVDTPGWDLESIKDNAEWVREEIKFSLSLCPPGPHALLLVIPVGSVSERERRAAQEHLELISERVWRHTIVLFTWGERLGDTTIEQHIERGGQELQRLVEEFGEKYYAFKNKSRDGTQVTELLEMIEEMVAENRGQFFTVKMYQEDNEQKLQILEDEIRNLTMEIDQVNQEMFQVDESKYDSQLKGKEKILIVLEGDQRRLQEKKESLEKQKNLKVEEVRNIKKYLRRWLPECSEGKAREGGKSHSAPRAEDQRAEPSSTMTPGLTASALGGAVGSVLWPAVVSLIGAAAWSALASGLMEQKEAVRDRH
ncbi:GTPase IMAP family member 9 [Amia ocellicauda]|uniref:GTPase IMAP family member 9 n=1 Tax=Amia ocellicauda TaxID=2972642 RepID=UPI0034646E2B